jgi:Holliday junction resolvasome RuvABC ATP-dependent DNA helicase subunit
MTTTKSKEVLFENIVGQPQSKRKLEFYIDSYKATRLIPHLLFVAPKGCGKTTIARETAKGLLLFDENGKVVQKDDGSGRLRKKTFVEINCASIKNVKQFINSTVIPLIQDKDCTVLFDEASELPKDVTMALLTILNPNPENRTTYCYDEYVCDFDFKRQSFIFATSEIHKVFHALADRCKRIDLEEYTFDHLAEIMQRGIKDMNFEKGLPVEIATVLRGNARAAQMMATDIRSYAKNKQNFKHKDWESLKATLGIAPLGLSPLEITVLRYLRGSAMGTSLTCLSAKTGMTRDALQKDVELYLQKMGLMTIATGGREITAKGIEYLNALDGVGKHAKQLAAPVATN